jgi:predicted alpha/beta hydrolase family esterase
VSIVQNPLTSLADDVAATRRVLARQDGPTILVGHSYGGTVIPQSRIAALCYSVIAGKVRITLRPPRGATSKVTRPS